MRSMLCLEVRPMHWGWVSDYVVTERQSWRWSWEPPLETPLETRSWGRSWNPVWDHPLVTPPGSRPGRPGRAREISRAGNSRAPGRPRGRGNFPPEIPPGEPPGHPLGTPSWDPFLGLPGILHTYIATIDPPKWGVWEGAFFTPPGGCPGGVARPPPGPARAGQKSAHFFGYLITLPVGTV